MKPNIEQAREELNQWEARAANDEANQHYIQAWADARGLTFVDVYTYLINMNKAAMLEVWGFDESEAWEMQAVKDEWHLLIGFYGPPPAVWEMASFAFMPSAFANRA